MLVVVPALSSISAGYPGLERKKNLGSQYNASCNLRLLHSTRLVMNDKRFLGHPSVSGSSPCKPHGQQKSCAGKTASSAATGGTRAAMPALMLAPSHTHLHHRRFPSVPRTAQLLSVRVAVIFKKWLKTSCAFSFVAAWTAAGAGTRARASARCCLTQLAHRSPHPHLPSRPQGCQTRRQQVAAGHRPDPCCSTTCLLNPSIPPPGLHLAPALPEHQQPATQRQVIVVHQANTLTRSNKVWTTARRKILSSNLSIRRGVTLPAVLPHQHST